MSGEIQDLNPIKHLWETLDDIQNKTELTTSIIQTPNEGVSFGVRPSRDLDNLCQRAMMLFF